MTIQTIYGGTYAEMLRKTEEIPEPKEVVWLLDHFVVTTSDDTPEVQPQEE